MKDWLDARQGSKNVYFHVNPTTRPFQGNGKPNEHDIRGVTALHVDLDPRPKRNIGRERKLMLGRLRKFQPPVSIIVDSGAGYHGFWLLDKEYNKIDPLSGYHLDHFNAQIARLLGGDYCHHIHGLMRIPGMINIPNALKVSMGRVASVAKLVAYDESRRYPLTSFIPATMLTQEEFEADSFVDAEQSPEGFALLSPTECPF